MIFEPAQVSDKEAIDRIDIQLSVYPQNENAVRFYEKCGFKVRNIRYQMYV